MNNDKIKLNFLNINKNNPIDIDEVVSYEVTGKKYIFYGKDNKFPLFINKDRWDQVPRRRFRPQSVLYTHRIGR